MVDLQEALTVALEERNMEVAEELIRRGCWINTGVSLPSHIAHICRQY
jgi:hypothetical protein